ncbi:hypothetical protein [Actinotalea fermentans]|uniref:Uncharacterized protein n=1 Tax=Actinotalea fermentans TaxID=43671 RepID=A0A511YTI2_9CELL|nr:hypothetical protein [Actinotalea fermentans]GEN78508.1 hypothetical protein AFE02nite_02420 [Actinotalea fermentans]
MSEQTHPEWGERRRRREEERRHVTGEQPAATPYGATAPEPPLSRRELRERAAAEAARAAESLARTTTPEPAPAPAPRPAPAPMSAPTPAPTPMAAPVSMPAPAPAPAPAPRPAVAPEPGARPLSRRELRERVAAVRHPEAEAAVSPPAVPSSPLPRTAPAPSPTPAPAAASGPRPAEPVVVPQMEPERPAVAPPSAALSPQARAAAIRAQAARAQAEREEAARQGIERAQSARGAAQRAMPEQTASSWGQRPQTPAAPESPRPTAPESSSPVRRVVLPPSGAPAAEQPYQATAGRYDTAPVTPARPAVPVYQAPAQPVAAPGERSFGAAQATPYQPQPQAQPQPQPYGAAQPAQARPAPYQPEQVAPALRPYAPRVGQPETAAGNGWQPEQPAAAGWPAEARTYPVPAVVPPAVATTGPSAVAPSGFEPVGFGGRDRTGVADASRAAFVPADIRPVVGQSFGTMQAAPAARFGAAAAPSVAATAPGATEPTDTSDAAMPRWGSVGSGQGWTPTPTSAPVAPSRAVPEDVEDEPDDEAAEPPRHPYTWLHMIVLVLVAFVLGMLIFVVLLRDSGAEGTQGAGVVGEGVTWSHVATTGEVGL